MIHIKRRGCAAAGRAQPPWCHVGLRPGHHLLPDVSSERGEARGGAGAAPLSLGLRGRTAEQQLGESAPRGSSRSWTTSVACARALEGRSAVDEHCIRPANKWFSQLFTLIAFCCPAWPPSATFSS